MRKLRIVADSSCDLLELEGVEFEYAPLKIITAEREFVDNRQLDVGEMVNFFSKYKGRSKTSCPNPSDWLTAFGDAEDVVCVTITSGLSGSYNAACAAKRSYEAEHPDRRVFVVDSLSAGPEVTLVTEKLRDMAVSGIDYEEMCRRIGEYKKNTGLIFMLKSLKNFANNGRVSPAVAKIAGLVGICIVGKASTVGTLEPTHKCRGESRSLDALLADLEAAGLDHGKVSIAHCYNAVAAERLKHMIHAKFKSAKVEIHPLRGLCSFYAELGGMLVGFEKM